MICVDNELRLRSAALPTSARLVIFEFNRRSVSSTNTKVYNRVHHDTFLEQRIPQLPDKAWLQGMFSGDREL
jgi:hypothetical protein